MKRVKRWVYYCDYCNKSGRSGGHMSRHEKHCTMNPNRVCKMCIAMGEEQKPIDELKKALEIAVIEEKPVDICPEIISVIVKNSDQAIEKLREVAHDCPMCMLSAIRQFTKYPMVFKEFDFKAAKEAFWSDTNDKGIFFYY